jgi:UPF0042 nucleotide-binding protein
VKLATGTISTLVVLAGLSGAGKSSGLDVLEDNGYFPVDNLPVPLLPEFLTFAGSSGPKYSRTALLVEIDSSTRLQQLMQFIKAIDREQTRVELIFIECNRETILRRYSETRRPHPGFNPVIDKTVGDAIDRERHLLLPFKEAASFVIDSSELTTHDFKRQVRQFIDTLDPAAHRQVRVNFQSFGFKYGLPPECDLVVDVRFLPNPHFVPELKESTGLDTPCAQYVLAQPAAIEFLDRYSALLNYLIPQYINEGKAYINIGVGCTGGRHRSVTLAEELRRRITVADCLLSVAHRDVKK